MERGLILLLAALVTLVTTGVQGTAHLSFANNTQVNITRAGCGTTKLCVETPSQCDPAGNSSCLFSSVVSGNASAPNGSELMFELRGDSMGYIALGLTVNASQGTTMLFICAQNSSDNGTFFFRTVDRNNSDGMLSPTETRVTEIQGMVQGSVIMCTFNVPNVNATSTRAADTTFSILLGNGTFDGNTFSPFNVRLDSGPLDLSNPSSNVVPTSAPSNVTTSMANNTTAAGSSGAIHPNAVLLLLSVLSLPAWLKA